MPIYNHFLIRSKLKQHLFLKTQYLSVFLDFHRQQSSLSYFLKLMRCINNVPHYFNPGYLLYNLYILHFILRQTHLYLQMPIMNVDQTILKESSLHFQYYFEIQSMLILKSLLKIPQQLNHLHFLNQLTFRQSTISFLIYVLYHC